MSSFLAHFELFFQHYGLLAVLAVLLLENVGLPVPGEVALVYAGYHARVYGSFGLAELIVLGTAACIIGQSAGYTLGRYADQTILRWVPSAAAHRPRFDAYFARYGGVTIVLARFVAGLRIVAGLFAGAGRMPIRPFLAYSALGAFLWVTVMAEVGAVLGSHWHSMMRRLGRVEIAVAVIAFLLILAAWRKIRHD